MHRACGDNDTACTVHPGSMTPHVFANSNFFSGTRTDVLQKKTEGRKSRDTVPSKSACKDRLSIKLFFKSKDCCTNKIGNNI
jgi:hypothetical protein